MKEVIQQILGRVIPASCLKAVTQALVGEGRCTAMPVSDPDSDASWIVLGVLPEKGLPLPDHPLVVKGSSFPSYEVEEKVRESGFFGRTYRLKTADVAGWFAGRARGLSEEDLCLPPLWAPAAQSGFYRVAIGGDLGEPKAETVDHEWDSNSYLWYDMGEVAVGSSVFRISCRNTLWLFTRTSEEHWSVAVVPSASWPRTSDGKDLGALLDGALSALRTLRFQEA